MKKVSILSGVIVFCGWAAVFLFYIINTEGPPKGSDIPVIIGFSVLSFLLPALLVYLGGFIIKKNKGAFRIGVLLSVIWVFGLLVVTKPYARFGGITDFLLSGVLPVFVFWGTIWVLNGFASEAKSTQLKR